MTSITTTHRGSWKTFNVSLPTGRKSTSPSWMILFYQTQWMNSMHDLTPGTRGRWSRLPFNQVTLGAVSTRDFWRTLLKVCPYQVGGLEGIRSHLLKECVQQMCFLHLNLPLSPQSLRHLQWHALMTTALSHSPQRLWRHGSLLSAYPTHTYILNDVHTDSNVKMLFIDFSSAFNTCILKMLIDKQSAHWLSTSMWN